MDLKEDKNTYRSYAVDSKQKQLNADLPSSTKTMANNSLRMGSIVKDNMSVKSSSKGQSHKQFSNFQEDPKNHTTIVEMVHPPEDGIILSK